MPHVVLSIASASLLAWMPALAQTAAAPPADRYVRVHCGWLLPVPGKDPQQGVTVVVKNGIVERLSPGLEGPDLSEAAKAGASVSDVDLRDRFVVPGLIDCHIHLSMEFSPDMRMRAVAEGPTDTAMRSVHFAKKTLEAGFTTVRDLGSNDHVSISLRDGIARGDVIGPRIIAAGKAVSVTGGHGDPSNGYREDLWGQVGADRGVADGPEECRKAVRYQVKQGADCIKFTATGGVLSASSAGLAQHFFEDELKAIVDTAHSMGRKAAAHAHGTDGINAAIRAGVDSIEHGTYMNDESFTLMKEHGTYYVPTMLAAETVSRNAEVPGYYLAVVAAKARLVGPKIMETVRKAHQVGVKIAFGTDTGVSPHGQNGREFALLVKAGLSPTETIVAATVSAADLLGLSSRVGTIEPGKCADLVGVANDPLRDVTEFERVKFVMRDGTVYRNDR